MNIPILIITFLLGVGVGHFIGRGQKAKGIPKQVRDDRERSFSTDAERKKNENLGKIREFLSTQADGRLDNKQVRELLGVSDATACRYLDELERENLIAQIGSDGPNVYYEKV